MHWHGEEDAKGHKKMMLIIYIIYIYIYKDVLKGVARMPYTNFTAWRSAQQSMREAFFLHLKAGTRPSKKTSNAE